MIFRARSSSLTPGRREALTQPGSCCGGLAEVNPYPVRMNLRDSGPTSLAGWLVAVACVSVSATVQSVLMPLEGSASAPAQVVRWVDGDTVVTTRGRVRLIGIDTPEKGECGYKKATRKATKMAPPGTRIALGNPDSVQDRDEYGRRLRYVGVGRQDIGLKQIKSGAAARYDSTDGYDAHPREGRYHTADNVSQDYCAGASTPTQSVDLGTYPPASISDCPANAPIKGNRGETEWIYHMPYNEYYGVTNPEECFATEAGAVAAGYRKAKV